MKQFISTILTSALLLNGCTSFKPLEVEDRAEGRPKPDERIQVILHNGSEIEAEGYLEVSEPSDFVFGVGKLFNPDIRNEIAFLGKLSPSMIDSCWVISLESKRILRCRLSDRGVVTFDEGKYVISTPDSGTGLWCVGTLRSSERSSDFAGRIPSEKIKEIEVRKFSEGKTFLLVSGIIVLAAAALTAAVLATDVVTINLGGGAWPGF